jgi:hypothetical protein
MYLTKQTFLIDLPGFSSVSPCEFRDYATGYALWSAGIVFKIALLKLVINGFINYILIPFLGVGIAQWYGAGLRAGWSGVRVAGRDWAARMALGPTQPPVQWVPGACSLGIKRAESWSWPLTTIYCRGQECVELYLHSSYTPPWRDAHLKNTGTTLPFYHVTLYSLTTENNVSSCGSLCTWSEVGNYVQVINSLAS